MTDDTKTTETRISIVRDNTFHRAVADNAIVISLGRDYEIAFIAISPIPILNVVSVDEQGAQQPFGSVALQNSTTEVARIRMGPEACRILAFQLLSRSIAEGETTITDVQANLEAVANVKISETGSVE